MPEHVASISYGKDSMAMLEIMHRQGRPPERIITAQVWFDRGIPGDYPELAEFKDRMDAWIKARYGIEVEHFDSGTTYVEQFYRVVQRNTKHKGCIYGWPTLRGPWCNKELKIRALDKAHKASEGCIECIGIAADEPERIARHGAKPNIRMPLVEAGITEPEAYKMCEELGCLAPTYQTGARDGCWFCHNQGNDQLRRLFRDYPELWERLLPMDDDSPVKFKPNGCTLRDYDTRFRAEREGLVLPTDVWDWGLVCPEKAAKRKRIAEIKKMMKRPKSK